jgi:hypothetical protein
MSPRAISLAVIALAALAGAPAALADSAESSNWAGYAVHSAGVTFAKVTGIWTQPQATCSGGRPTYSAVWVGIGGYNVTSQALEQTGTEADCTADGHGVSSGWYELVPAPSRTIKRTIAPGDRVRGTVVVKGNEVTMTLDDLTGHRSFTKRLHAVHVDTTSAEWILEAPTACLSVTNCHTLPLADFGSAGFAAASAMTTTGHRGTITDRKWTATRISLAAGGRQFVSGPGASIATAVPSAPSSEGSAFTVTYRGLGTSAGPVRGNLVAGDRLTRPALSPSS